MPESLARPLGTIRVGEKGEITVPAAYRKRYKLAKGSEKTPGLSGPKSRQPQRYEKLFPSSFKCKPLYIRAYVPGGTFFFTPVTYQRHSLFRQPAARRALRDAIQQVRSERPFTINAFVVMPDHIHMVWTLPPGDADFSTRWRLIKHFTTRHLSRVGRDPPYTIRQSASRQKKHERPVWQRRFWEHVVRSEDEFARLCEYIHYNPVKHGYARCPHAWPYSSFHRFVHAKLYPQDWLCIRKSPRHGEPDFGVDDDIVGE